MNPLFSMVPGDSVYPPLRAEISTLFGAAAYDEKQHYLDFITRFVAIITSPFSVSPSLRNYLLSEGGKWALDGTPLGASHLLYWLDRQLKTKLRDEHELYVDRLSEMAGWGEAAPDSLTEADPLGLVTTLEGLGCKVIIFDRDCDPAGSNNLDAASTTGCVRVNRNSTNGGTAGDIKCVDNTTNKTTAGLFPTATTLRYKLYLTLEDFNERNGGGRRFPIGTGAADATILAADCFALIRNSVTKHVVSKENQIGITAASQTQARSVTFRGYPGEWPQVWCGNSADDDATPTEVPDATPPDGATSGTPNTFVISPADGKERNNVHFRNIHFRGKRETAGGDWIYAETILNFTAHGTGHSVRHCKFTDNQPIQTGDYNEGDFPEIVDFAFDARTAEILRYNSIVSGSADIVIDSNEFEPVPILADVGNPDGGAWPNDTNSAAWTIATSQGSTGGGTSGKIQFTTTATHDVEADDIIIVADTHTGWTGETKIGRFTVGSVGASTITTTSDWPGGTGGINGTLRVSPLQTTTGYIIWCSAGAPRITRNSFLGHKSRIPVLLEDVDGAYVAHNNFEIGCGIQINIKEDSANFIVEHNRHWGWGRDFDGNGADIGGAAIVPQGNIAMTDGIIRDNMLFNTERQANSFTFGIWTKETQVRTLIYGNILYRTGIYCDADSSATQLIATVSGNLIVGMPENAKIRSAGKYNAPFYVLCEGLPGDVPGTLNDLVIDGNQFWRFANATPDQATIEAGDHLKIENGAGSDGFEVTDTLAGWTNNFVGKPDWTGDPEAGDFRLTTTTLDFPVDMPFTEAMSQAWEAD